MYKHCLHWKTIKAKDVRLEDFESRFPEVLNSVYRGNLLTRILAMSKQTPISFEKAALMAQEKWHEMVAVGNLGYAPGQCHWYCTNFVDWIAEQGFHIELTGDEFEAYVVSSKVS